MKIILLLEDFFLKEHANLKWIYIKTQQKEKVSIFKKKPRMKIDPFQSLHVKRLVIDFTEAFKSKNK